MKITRASGTFARIAASTALIYRATSTSFALGEKAGAAGSVHDVLRDRRLPHRVEVIAGVREAESAALLREFFESKR